jgi:hypothetical protein
MKKSVQFSNLQLKYCERCGNIWLRRTTSQTALCAPCARAELALSSGPGGFLQIWSRLRAEAQA